MQYTEMSKQELSQVKAELQKKYDDLKALGLNLNMARGKPGADQLDLSMKLLDMLNSSSDIVHRDGLPQLRYAGRLAGNA